MGSLLKFFFLTYGVTWACSTGPRQGPLPMAARKTSAGRRRGVPSAQDVATISATGLATSLGVGQTTIQASSGAIKGLAAGFMHACSLAACFFHLLVKGVVRSHHLLLSGLVWAGKASSLIGDESHRRLYCCTWGRLEF